MIIQGPASVLVQEVDGPAHHLVQLADEACTRVLLPCHFKACKYCCYCLSLSYFHLFTCVFCFTRIFPFNLCVNFPIATVVGMGGGIINLIDFWPN